MWSKNKENSYSLEEFQLFCEYIQDTNKEPTLENLLDFLRLLRTILKNE